VSIEFSEKYYTTAEAAKMLHVTPDTVKRYCNQDPQRLKGIKVGNGWMIPRSEIKAYIANEGDQGRPRNRRGRAG